MGSEERQHGFLLYNSRDKEREMEIREGRREQIKREFVSRLMNLSRFAAER